MQRRHQIAASSTDVSNHQGSDAALYAAHRNQRTTWASTMTHRSIAACLMALVLFCAATISSTVKAADTAANDPMSVYYENTLTCAGGEKDNWLCYSWYYSDGSFREMQVIRRRDGFIALHNREGSFKATQTAAGVTLCQTFNDSADTWCHDLPAHKVGDQWTETLASGQPQKFSIIKGRALLNFLSGDGKDTHIIAPYTYADYPPDPKNRIDNVGAASR